MWRRQITIVSMSMLLFSMVTSCNKKEPPTTSTPVAQKAQTSQPPASIEALATQSTERLLAQPEIKKALEGSAQGATDDALDRLARRGWKRLSDDHLLQRVTVRRKLLSSVDVTTCAAVVRDKATQAQTHTALATLGTTDVQTFFALKETAALAEAKDQKPPKMVLQEQFPEAFGSLLKGLPAEQADHLGELLTGDPARATDDDICWAEKTFLDALITLQEPYRSTLARAVVQ